MTKVKNSSPRRWERLTVPVAREWFRQATAGCHVPCDKALERFADYINETAVLIAMGHGHVEPSPTDRVALIAGPMRRFFNAAWEMQQALNDIRAVIPEDEWPRALGAEPADHKTVQMLRDAGHPWGAPYSQMAQLLEKFGQLRPPEPPPLPGRPQKWWHIYASAWAPHIALLLGDAGYGDRQRNPPFGMSLQDTNGKVCEVGACLAGWLLDEEVTARTFSSAQGPKRDRAIKTKIKRNAKQR